MMDFPSSPTVGQQYPTVPVNGMPIYLWDGVKWKGSMSTPPYTKAEADAKFVDVSGDVMTGHLGLPTSPAATNAVRKDYVDAAVAGTVSKSYVDTQDALKLDKTGGTINGNLSVTNGDLRSYRAGGGTGVVYLSSGDRYIYWDGSNYSLGGLGTIWSSGNLNPQSALGYTPVNRSGDTMWGQLATPVSGSIVTGGSVPTIMVQGGGNDWACMSFLSQGVFGANFGMHPNGNFYVGGWSHGGNAYQFWTTRDFGSVNANNVTSVRLAYLGDRFVPQDGLDEPWGGGVVTGGGFNSDGYSYRTKLRYRQLQVCINGGWPAVGYV